MLFDGDGNRMTPSHAVKKGTRYRYYVSRSLIIQTKAEAQTGLRLPAAEIEQIVTSRICGLLAEPGALFEIVQRQVADRATQQRLIAGVGDLARNWSSLSPLRTRVILLTLVQRIEVRVDGIAIHLLPSRLGDLLEDRPTDPPAPTESATERPVLTIAVAAELCRAGKEIRMIIDPGDPGARPREPNPVLIRAIVRGHRFNAKLAQGELRSFGDLACSEKLHRFYLTQLLRLAYLAPDITAAILDGKQPTRLTATRLIEHPSLPISWRAQRRAFGFPDTA